MNKLTLYFGFLMIAVYVAIGLLLIFSNYLLDIIPQNRTLFGSLFIGYAVFRSIMTIQRIKKANNQSTE